MLEIVVINYKIKYIMDKTLQFGEYKQEKQKPFLVYPMVKACPVCIKLNRKHGITTTNDGNRHQKCTTCNWRWDAPK